MARPGSLCGDHQYDTTRRAEMGVHDKFENKANEITDKIVGNN